MEDPATPTTTPPRKKLERPEKPPGSPLYWHPRGYWMIKRFSEEWRYEADHDRSLARFKVDLDSRLKGLESTGMPRKRYLLKDAINLYLNKQKSRHQDGELSDVQFTKCRTELEFHLLEAIPATTPLSDFRASHPGDDTPARTFREIRSPAIARGLHAAHRHITLVRACLDMAASKHYMQTPDYSDDFDVPSKDRLDRERNKADIEHGARQWSTEELRSILNEARVMAGPRKTAGGIKPSRSPHLYAQMLLALFAGFGSDDCSAVPEIALKREHGVISFPRVKNGRPRAAWLPPVVWEAIDESLKHRAAAKTPEAKSLLFRTTIGTKCNVGIKKHDAKGLLSVGRNDTIGQNFKRLVKKMKLHRRRAGFKTLRAMFRTLLMSANIDGDLIAVLMGRRLRFAVDEYYIRGDLRSQLVKAGGHLERQLFPKAKTVVKQTQSQSPKKRRPRETSATSGEPAEA